MRIGRTLAGVTAVLGVVSGSILVSPPALASTVSVVCGGGPTTQSTSVAVGETLVIDFGACSGINAFSSPVGSFYRNGSPVTSVGALSISDSLTYSSTQAGQASIELDSATLNISVTSGSSDGHVPGTGVPRPQDVPNQAGAVTATAGIYSATVSWSIPTQPGEAPVWLYEVTSAPDGKQCTSKAPSTSCQVKGLRGGTTYTFSVKSFNTIGWGPASAASNAVVAQSVTPAPPTNPFTTIEGPYVRLDWDRPDSALGEPFTYEVQSANCSDPCTDPKSLDFSDRQVFHYFVDRFAFVREGINRSAPVARVRTVDVGGSVSDWVYMARVNPIKRIGMVQAYSDASGSLVSWQDDANAETPARGFKAVSGYKVYYRTVPRAGGAESAWRTVGETTKDSLLVGRRTTLEGQRIQFIVVPRQSAVHSLVYPDTPEVDGTVSNWRREIDRVPTPKIVDVSLGRTNSRVSVEWQTGEGDGVINIVSYEIQYRDKVSGKWSDSAMTTARPDRLTGLQFFDFNVSPQTLTNVNGLRIRAVSWPGKNFSYWAEAVN